MDKHLTDNSAIELDNPLYMQERIKILEQALDDIEEVVKDKCRYDWNTLRSVLIIINQAKEITK